MYIIESPTFQLDQSEDMEVLLGSNVKLACTAKGDPKPVINWFYNGRILKNRENV